MIRRSLKLLIGIAGLAAAGGASAQRYAPPEVDRPDRTCTQIAQMCMQRQGQANCEGLKQECFRTGTWQGSREITRSLQRR